MRRIEVFVYFFEGCGAVGVRELERLPGRVLERGFSQRQGVEITIHHGGTETRRGALAGHGDLTAIKVEEVGWRELSEVLGREELRGLWIGSASAKASADCFARGVVCPGEEVRLLGDGTWCVPFARRFEAGCVLPGRLVMRGGILEREVLDEFVELGRRAEEVFEEVVFAASAGEGSLTIREGWELAVDALNVNYRVGRAEVGLLGLLDEGLVLEVLRVLVDWRGFLEGAERLGRDVSLQRWLAGAGDFVPTVGRVRGLGGSTTKGTEGTENG